MPIEGVWKVNYSVAAPQPFINVGDPDEAGIIIIQDGVVMGQDPWGSQYTGKYTLEGSLFKVVLTVDAYCADVVPVIPGLVHPFTMEMEGEFNSPDHFSVRGKVVDAEVLDLMVNCKRLIKFGKTITEALRE